MRLMVLMTVALSVGVVSGAVLPAPRMSLESGKLLVNVPAKLRGQRLRLVERSLANSPDEESVLAWEGVAGRQIVIDRIHRKHDRLFRTWQLVDMDNRKLTHSFHVVDVKDRKEGFVKPVLRPKEIKGVSCIVGIEDAAALGTKYIHENLNIIELWMGEGDAIEHEYDGEVFRFNKHRIKILDDRMRQFYNYGIGVFLVYTNGFSNYPALCPPGVKKDPHMNLAGFNTETPEGARYYGATCDFLASRYGRDDAKYGQMCGFIVGNEVQMHFIWYNLGEAPVEKVAVEYSKAVRIAQLAAWNWNPDLRIYVSLEHHWTHGNPKSKRMVPGRTLLEFFDAEMKAGGDIPWNLAHHPYPENLFNPKFWNDKTAKPNFDTPRITFRNLDQLVKFFKQPKWKYRGKKMRDIALTEQGFNYNPSWPDGEIVQAAAYAYGYKLVKRHPEISAFIHHRHIDHALEGGLHLGFRAFKPGTISTPGEKRMIYDVFKAAGTPDEDKAFAFALPVIGIKSWDETPEGPAEPKSIFSYDEKDLVYDFRGNFSRAEVNRNSPDCRVNEVMRAAGWLVSSIYQHPPEKGWSELTFRLILPEKPKGKKLVIAWEAMVDNDASTGVRFRLLINGKERWNEVCMPRVAPKPGEVDLTSLAGQEILVTFGTEANGNMTGDWANWIQPVIFKR